MEWYELVVAAGRLGSGCLRFGPFLVSWGAGDGKSGACW